MTALTAKRIWLSGLALFAVLSLIDFAQTYVLISGGDGAVYEANPVADAWLQRHGWGGLAAFKLGAVAVFIGAATLLLNRRPQAGAGVMALGCAALLTVTVYSSRLIANSDMPREDEHAVVDLDHFLAPPGEPGSYAPAKGVRSLKAAIPLRPEMAE